MKFCTLLYLTCVATAQPSAPQNAPTPLARLEGNIQRITKSVNANWGIYIKCLETGEEIALNADQQMDTMSVIKIPLMAEAFRQMEAGKFALTDRIKLTDAAKRPGTGVIQSLDPGVELTIKDLLTLMIVVSDNTATDLMYDKVGGTEQVNQLMHGWGLNSIRATGTADVWFKALRAAGTAEAFHQQAKTPFGLSSPRDMGKLLEKMEKGEAVSQSASDQMLQIMRRQLYSSRLPRYVSGFRIPHKTGDFLPYIGNDVGILESNSRRVVMSVFTAKHFGAGVNLEDAIGRIAELTANYFAARP
ncbi:MAG TPA: serine hydrolase [Candidatus Acidoferrales bacterium]|jgi:beta-lactamase class A|nr:serine hydrolase [Candidatus Acidoferrales bacterium]